MTDPTTPLSELRASLDALDGELLALLKKRQEISVAVAQRKQAENRPIRDMGREREVLAERRRRAEALGLPGDIVDQIWRLVMLASRQEQAARSAGAATGAAAKTIALIGGSGAMGALFARLLKAQGHEVLVADLDTALRPKDAAARADVVILSVPIDVTERVAREIGSHVRKDALLMDFTSIKRAPLDAMLGATEASVLGAHPMFGPGVNGVHGQRMVLCPGRGDEWFAWARENFGAMGMAVVETDADAHDRAMSVVQVLLHYRTQVLGLTLARLGIPLEEGLAFTSPAYLLEVYVAARHFAQSSQLYGPIEMRNPRRDEVTQAFRDAAAEVAEILARGDQAAFDALFDEVGAFFGDFREEAVEQSRFLIDRLVELSDGKRAGD